MIHASPASLALLEPLLLHIRRLDGLVERKPGIFYRKSSAFLHFHEDAEGLFADVKWNGTVFERMPVSSTFEREAFWQAVSAARNRTQSVC